MLGCGTAHVLRQVRAGALPARRPSRAVLLFRRADLEAFAAAAPNGRRGARRRVGPPPDDAAGGPA